MNSGEGSRITFKILFKGEWRRISLCNPTFVQLTEKIFSIFALSPALTPILKYQDNERDDITLSSDLELAESIQLFQPGPVRLTLQFTAKELSLDDPRMLLALRAREKYISKFNLSESEMPQHLQKVVLDHHHYFQQQQQQQEVPQDDLFENSVEISERPEVQLSFDALSKNGGLSHTERLNLCQSILDSSFSLQYNLKVLQQGEYSDGEQVPPNTSIIKIWKIFNSGLYSWPEGSGLQWISGDQLQLDPQQIKLRPLDSGKEDEILVEVTTPSKPGRYVSYWRPHLPDGTRFGHRMWIDFEVQEAEQIEPPHQISSPSAADVDLLSPEQLEVYQMIVGMGFDPSRVYAIVRLGVMNVEEALVNLLP